MEEKTLKFKNELAKLILAEAKTSTWRLFDDKNLTAGDGLILVNSDTGEKFARAVITEVREKKLADLNGNDWIGHEKFSSEEEMYQTYSEYYKRKVTRDDLVKIIKFKLV